MSDKILRLRPRETARIVKLLAESGHDRDAATADEIHEQLESQSRPSFIWMGTEAIVEVTPLRAHDDRHGVFSPDPEILQVDEGEIGFSVTDQQGRQVIFTGAKADLAAFISALDHAVMHATETEGHDEPSDDEG